MIYIKLINAHNENVNNIVPNVTFCKAEQHIYYNPYIPPVPKLLDILYSDAEGNLYFSSEVLPASDGKTPIALCITPPEFFGNKEKARWMSLKYMSYETPDTGSTVGQGVYYGDYELDISAIDNIQLTHMNGQSEGYLNTDYHDNSAQAKKIPDIVNSNNEWNLTVLGDINAYAVTDIDGKNKTEKILATATAQPNWATDELITNNANANYTPAACCCARYHTLGTSMGDWYLGAAGEMGMILVNKTNINNKLSEINEVYPNNCIQSLNDNVSYITSTEYNENRIYRLYLQGASIALGNKNTGHYAIALLQY